MNRLEKMEIQQMGKDEKTDAMILASIEAFPYLSIQEHTQILKVRARQLQNGKPTRLLPNDNNNKPRRLDDEMELAYKELHTGVLNHLFLVNRMFPTGSRTNALYKILPIPLYMLKLKDDY